MPSTVALLDSSVDRRVLAVPLDGMVNVSERVADVAAMAGWFELELAGTGAGQPDVAGSLIAYRFSSALADLASALLVEHDIGLAPRAREPVGRVGRRCPHRCRGDAPR